MLAVEACCPHVDHREAVGTPVPHCLDDPLLDRRDVLPRHGPTRDLVDKFEPLAPLERLDADRHHTELAVTTGLLLVLALRLVQLRDRLPIGDQYLLADDL